MTCLATRPPVRLAPFFLVYAHEDHLLAYTALGIPRSRGAEPLRRRLEEASARDANGYQATISDRFFPNFKY